MTLLFFNLCVMSNVLRPKYPFDKKKLANNIELFGIISLNKLLDLSTFYLFTIHN